MDPGHEATELILQETEKEIQSLYKQAQLEAQAKLNDHLSKFKVKDKIKREQLKKGLITEEQYNYWRQGQICIGNRWQEMVDAITQDYVNADKLAMSVVNGHTPDAYALNHNYGTFQVESSSLIDTSYTLYDRQTVERLIRENPDLLPKATVDIPADRVWNKTHIKNAITQGILQGDDLKSVAKRLQQVTDMDHRAAIRNARTMMTGAQNAGRVDSYRRAEGMGIALEQEWLATLDGRTRDSHRHMDGQHVKVGEKFDNGCRYPGDPNGPPWEVYNCRCTLVPFVSGIDQSDAPRFSRLGDMSYEDWKYEHENREYVIEIPDIQRDIGNASSVSEINDILNGHGWFLQRSSADLTGCDLQSAKAVASAFQRVFDRYPQLTGKIAAPNARPVGMKNEIYAWCYIRGDGQIQVSPSRYNDWDKLTKSYDDDVRFGWHPRGTTAESIVTHELGHAIDGLLAKSGVIGGYTSAGELRMASSVLRSSVMKEAGFSIAETAQQVSTYATKDPQEWFAECFAEYTTSADPRPVAVAFGRRLEELMKKLK